MARTFNRAYDQADRMLNTSGLSSLVHRQGGGGMITSVHGKPIPRYTYRDNGGPVIRRFGGGGYSDEDAGVEETSYGGGVEDWGISAADMEAAYSTGAFGPELAKESFFNPPDIESQREHGSSPHDVIRHGEAYGKPPGSQEQSASDYYLGGDTSLSDFTGVGGQPSPEMKRRGEIRRQQGLRGMIQGGFDSPKSYRDYMNHWKKAAEKERSDRYWAENPSGRWVTENYGGTKGTSLVLPEQAPISKNDAINNVLEDDTLSPEEKQEQIDYIFMWGPVVNRDMGRLKTASRLNRERTIDRDRAKGYFPIAPPKRRTYKEGGKIMPGGLSGINKSININGQPHSLAWINPGEASALKAMGGSGKKVDGIPAYFDEWSMGGAEAEQQMADVFHDVEGAAAPAPVEYDYDTPSYQQLISPEAQADLGSATTYQDGVTSTSADTTYDSDVKRDYQSNEEYRRLTKQDFLDGKHSNKLNPFINALYASGMITDQVGDYIASLSGNTISGMMDAYDEGYSFGGPMGTLRGLSRDQGTDYTKKLKLKDFAKELKDLKDKNLSQEDLDKQKGELFSKYQDIAKEYGANITENKRFKGMYSGLEEEAAKREGFMPKAIGAAAKYGLLPGSFATAGLAGIANLLTDLFGVVGEFTTKEGQSYRLMEDGTLVEPDIYTPSQSDNDPMASIQKPRPVRQASVSEEVDKPLTGIAALQQERSEVASIAERLQPQFDNIASIFGREEAAKMLGQPVNIFA